MTMTATSKSVFLLVYETLAEFEIAVLLTALRGTNHSLTTVGLTRDPVTTTGHLQVVPEMSASEVDPALVDALIVPGGEATHAMGNEDVRALIHHLDARHALLAAICGGPAVLGDAGALDGRRYTASLEPSDAAFAGVRDRGSRVPELLVTDHHVVTAVGSAYLAFAEEVLRHLDDAPAAEPLTYFREPSLS